MFSHLSLDNFLELAKSNQRITVYREISSDTLTPINAYRALAAQFHDVALLESGAQSDHSGYFSYLCFDSYTEISSKGENIHIKDEHTEINFVGDPLTILREYQKKLRAKIIHPLSALVGGMVGFLSYEAIHLFEPALKSHHTSTNDIADLHFKFYRTCIAFDHRAHKAVIATLANITDDAALCYDATQKIINDIIQQLTTTSKSDQLYNSMPPQAYPRNFSVDVTDEHYHAMVHRAQQHIIAGDIFQVVLSRQFTKSINIDPFEIYRALRILNPSPYMFFIDHHEFQILGASPEKLVSVKNNVVESCPLAGTRPIHPQQPLQAIEQDLLSDEKEIAEHMMLVDLARNDVGAVAVAGSVTVTELMKIKKFSHVMHLSSTVQGELQHTCDSFDALKAAFPAGTLSGAPKIRAMEIIHQLETSPRGIYGGAICSVDSLGNLDSCILIRSAFVKDNQISVRAGAGIVFDSNPKIEAQETQHKAHALLQAIIFAEEKYSS